MRASSTNIFWWFTNLDK